MKPTGDQQKVLKKYLRKNLSYSETSAEFYDHILTAVESMNDICFEDAVNRVINNDFGGGDGLVAIEDRYRKQTIKEMQRRYLGYIVGCLKFPYIGLLIISSIIIYYVVKQPWYNFGWFCGMFFSIALVPPILNGIRYARRGYLFGDTKRSVKDEGFLWLKYLPGTTFGVFVIFHSFYLKDTPITWFKHANPVVVTAILMAYVLHGLSYYKMSMDEFKISII